MSETIQQLPATGGYGWKLLGGFVLFPKAAAKGSFKKRAVFKDCHQTSPKVLLK